MKKLKLILEVSNVKRFYSKNTSVDFVPVLKSDILLPKPEYNLEFFCNPLNRDLIARNISKRESSGNIDKVMELIESRSQKELLDELSRLPNFTDNKVFEYPNNQPCVLKMKGNLPQFNFEPQEFSKLMTRLNTVRTDRLGPVSGSRSYLLFGDLAELEQALVAYSLNELSKRQFQLISVPDILPSQIIERCGLISDGDRKLVFEIEPYYGGAFSLSGTAEMGLAYKLSNRLFLQNELPLKLVAVSRCYRAEVSNLLEERGIYRVHQFTKVEMFICSSQNESAETMDEIIAIQENLFERLGLYFKIIDMPANELGSPAYKKVDIESWMPGRKQFGELSSCSNCTDYQSRRLNIKYANQNGKVLHAHTLNGTACAIPRMLIAICEKNQLLSGNVSVPQNLTHLMNGNHVIEKQLLANMKPLKSRVKSK